MGEHDDRIRRALQDEAGRYEPDRDAMADRIAQGRIERSRAVAEQKARNSPRRLFSMRPVLAAFAVAGVLVASMVTVRLTDDGGPAEIVAEPPPPATAPVAVGGPSPSVTPGDTTTGRPGSRPPAGTTPPAKAPPATTTPPAGPAGASWLSTGSARGKDSVATWTENTVTVTTTKPTVSLAVSITVAATPGAAYAGKWTNVPNSDVEFTLDKAANELTYTYRLRDGVTLRAGKWTFAAQFSHRTGRGTSADAYLVEAATGSAAAEKAGAFS